MHLVAIGGSDAGISAASRARELDPSAEVTVVVADARGWDLDGEAPDLSCRQMTLPAPSATAGTGPAALDDEETR